MKNTLLIFLIVALFSCKVTRTPSAGSTGNPTLENDKYTFTYDFSDRKTWKEQNPKIKLQSDRVAVHVENINRLAYIISFSDSVSAISLQNTSLFDTLANTLSGANTTTTGTKAPFVKQPATTAYENSYDSLLILQGQIKTDYQSLRSNLIKLSAFFSFCQYVPVAVGNECCSQTNLQAALVASPYLKTYDPTITTLPALSGSAAATPDQILAQIATLSTSLTANKAQADKYLQDLTTRCSATTGIDPKICPQLGQLQQGYPDDLQAKLTLAGKLTRDSVDKAVTALETIIGQIQDKNNFFYSTTDIYPSGDFLDVSTKMQPKPGFSVRQDSLFLHLKVVGRFEWAIGPALNFGFTGGAFDNSYTIDTARNNDGSIKTDTFSIKKNPQRTGVAPSIGLMAHFYWQGHTNLTPGIAVGLSTAVNNLSNLKAYLGCSLLIGGFDVDSKKNLVYNKFILTAGLSYGQVARLKSNLQEGLNPKSQVPFTGNAVATDQLTQQVGRLGLFFGVTYKLN